jgi:uncharacterized protein YkwD
VHRFARRAAVIAALVAGPVLACAGPALASRGAAEKPAVAGGAVQPVVAGGASQPVAADAAAKPAVATDRAAYENAVVALTNAQRTAKGCPALRRDDRLVAAARAHSADMVRQGFFDHTGSDGSSFVAREIAAGYPRKGPSAENIAWGYRTPRDVVTGWMHSPGHRANILNCGSVAVGVGLVYRLDGTAYWTQDFGRI